MLFRSVEGNQAFTNGDAEVVLVRFKRREETKIRAGENRGKVLVNHHIVTGFTKLGPLVLDADPLVFDTDPDPSDGGCAVLVQARAGGLPGPILGAALCPGPGGKAS